MEKNRDKDNATESEVIAESLAGSGSLDTVRDILFGAQFRESNTNVKRMEEGFSKSLTELRKEYDKELSNVRQVIDTLKQKMASENDEVHIIIESLDAKSKTALQDMHDELSASRDKLEKQTKGWVEDLAKQLDIVHDQLMNRKADRKLVSTLLSKMAADLMSDAKESDTSSVNKSKKK